MPGRIIALYVILCLRLLVNGTALAKSVPPSSSQEALTSTLATLEVGACLFMLISLYHRKSWVVWVFRAYIAVSMPVSLLFMWIAAIAKQRNGEAMAWNAFVGGVIGAIGFSWFAWYVGRGPTRSYLRSFVAGSMEPPLLEELHNQAPDRTAPSVTPPAVQEPRH